ncbi:MAG: DUF3397 family protein [Alkalibacterium sp.]|nr:MAG: DUF3397 family protein [Alkalibacterium sp.]
MDMTVSDGFWWFFYFLPIIILLFSKKINRQFKLVSLTVRAVDILIPYLIIVNYISVQLLFDVNSIPYIIILLSISGMLIATYQTFRKNSLILYVFFRLWWRVVFLVLITLHFLIGIWVALSYVL